MKHIIFLIVIFTNILGILGALFSILFPKSRIWPPPRKNSWQFWSTWIVLTIGLSGVTILGFLDWGSIGFNHWIRYIIGIFFMLCGISLIIWGAYILGLNQSLGLSGLLITIGPYKFTRNPQYLGYLIFYPGFIIFTSSFMALVSGILVMLIFILAPFAEEPWLREKFGEEYEKYVKQVPRFL
jgi:protein-S-isoprenylcysteine O-methyltransferase Ste14